MCRSLTYAQSAARVLEKNAISAAVRKAPSGLSGSGCSYSVSVSYTKGAAAAGVLRRCRRSCGNLMRTSESDAYCLGSISRTARVFFLLISLS